MSATDLDAFIPEDKQVTFRKRLYVLPGDLPMETYLRLTLLGQLEDAGADIAETLEQTISVLTDLFTDGIAGETERAEARDRLAGAVNEETGKRAGGEFRKLGLPTIFALIQNIYPPPASDHAEVDADDVIEGAEADAPPTADGTTSTTKSLPQTTATSDSSA